MRLSVIILRVADWVGKTATAAREQTTASAQRQRIFPSGEFSTTLRGKWKHAVAMRERDAVPTAPIADSAEKKLPKREKQRRQRQLNLKYAPAQIRTPSDHKSDLPSI